MLRKIFFLAGTLALLSQTALAQLSITICGSKFMVEINKQTMTAKIVDYYYNIDDHKYPYSAGERYFKDKTNNTTLLIPETANIDGEEYTITAIGQAAFAGYRDFIYIKIPETINEIGDYAFFRTALREVYVPSSVVKIGKRAFARCEDLKRIVLPANISMNDNVYGDCNPKLAVSIHHDPTKTETRKFQQELLAKATPTTSDIDENIPVTSHRAENTFAIIIANENYQNDPAVDFALREGNTFKTYCQQVLGIPEENIRLQEDATLNNIRSLVNWISMVADAYEGDAQIIFYYSGHGVPDDKGNTNLLPIDGTAKDPATGYSLHTLYQKLGSLATRNVCVFLDACFSGKQRNEDMLVAARGVRRAKEETPIGNMVVFSASQEDETAHAYPEKAHGMFTYFLCKKLQESKGNVTLGELSDYVRQNVLKRSTVMLNTTQTPTTSSSPKLLTQWREITLK